MANSLLTPNLIAKEALLQLENSMVLGNLVHRDFRDDFVKAGDTVSIRRPVKFLAQSGATLVKQDVEEGNVDIVIDQRRHVGWEFASRDLTLAIDDYSERYIKPAMITLANEIDLSLAGLYRDVWNLTGTPGVTPASFADIGAAGKRLDQMAVPRAERAAVFDPEAAWALADGLKSVTAQDKALGAYEEARIGRFAAFDTYGDQNIRSHVVGALGGTPLVNGAGQSVTWATARSSNSQTLATDGWTPLAAVLKAGDVFTVAGVQAVNPVSKDVLPFLQQFVVKADATANGTGEAVLTISPAIVVAGPYRTVSAAPADNAAIAVVTGLGGSLHPQSLAFHKNAFALVTVPLDMPDGAGFANRVEYKGLSVRVVKDYDIAADTEIIRLDILYGVKAVYPDLACRITG